MTDLRKMAIEVPIDVNAVNFLDVAELAQKQLVSFFCCNIGI